MFSDQKNSDGLPIPLTAAEVHAEARRRVEATQQHALKWGWFYRSIAGICSIPKALRGLAVGAMLRVKRAKTRMVEYWRRARLDAKRRTKAAIAAQLERCDMGYSMTEIPEHTTRLGRACEFVAEALYTLQELAARNAPAAGSVATQFGIHLGVNAFIASAIPMILSAAPIVACDPFLFIELPDEPGKLRHIGHWYWQEKADGESQLHVHI